MHLDPKSLEAAELVERLNGYVHNCPPGFEKEHHADMMRSAYLIQSQAARIAELEAAMEPFADRYDAWGDAAKGPYTNEDYTPRMVADFARARALLNRRAEG